MIRESGGKLVSELQEQHSRFTETFTQLVEKSNAQLAEIRSEYDVLSNGLGQEHSSFLSEAKQDYENLKAFYQTELALKAPVNYWAYVASRHRVWAAVWGSLFALLLLGFAAMIIKSAQEILS
ncbi:hypothetical protein FBQ85_23750 [Cytophagia bacterium CHB2]|nr:hypothetical protein [Cytophagia bacterium CHB2]